MAHASLEVPSHPMIQQLLIFTFSFWVSWVITFSWLQAATAVFLQPRDSSFVLMSRVAMRAVKCILLSTPGWSLFIICLFTLDLDGSIVLLFSGEIYLSSHFLQILESIRNHSHSTMGKTTKYAHCLKHLNMTWRGRQNLRAKLRNSDQKTWLAFVNSP